MARLAWLDKLDAQLWAFDGFDSHVADWLAQLPKSHKRKQQQKQYEDAFPLFIKLGELLDERKLLKDGRKSQESLGKEATDRLLSALDEEVRFLYAAIGLGPDVRTPSAPTVADSASGGVEPNKAGPKVGKGSADAPKRETQQAASSPKFSMRLNALIKAHIQDWPTIETDIKAASDNGLSAAKAGARGWWEERTMEWARANGKLKSAAKPTELLAQAMHNLGSLPSRTNRL